MTRILFFLLFLLFSTVYSQDSASLFDVARKGSQKEIRNIVDKDPKAVNAISPEGYSVLTLACYNKNNEVAKYLVEKGSNVDANSSMGTPLMASVVKGNLEMATVLLDNKANPNLTDANKTTALIYAVQFKNADMVRLLLDYKTDKSLKDNNGKTAFEYAVFSNNEEMINLLKD